MHNPRSEEDIWRVLTGVLALAIRWISLVLLAIFNLGFAWSSFAQDICSNAAGQADMAVREQYQHTIDYFIKIAAAAQMKGFDPTNFPQADNSGNIQAINLVDIIQRLSSQRDEAIAQIYQAFLECRNNIAPYQRIVDVASFFCSEESNKSCPSGPLTLTQVGFWQEPRWGARMLWCLKHASI